MKSKLLSNAEMITPSSAAERLGVSLDEVHRLAEAKVIDPIHAYGKLWAISAISVDHALARPAARAAARRDAISIVVIDDDPVLRNLYARTIATWSTPVRVELAENAYRGLVLIGSASPDIVVVDLRLPRVDGFQLIRALDEMIPRDQMTIVAASGVSDLEFDMYGGLPPHIELLGKPIDFARLKDIAESVWQSLSPHQRPASRL